MTFGKIVQDIRKSSSLSQEEFGELFNVTRQSVSKWETDAAMPELDTLIKIADYSNLSIDYLLGREQKNSDEIKTNLKRVQQIKMKFRLGILIAVIGLVILTVTLSVDYIALRFWGNPIRMLIEGSFISTRIWYLTLISLIISGIIICWMAIHSN